MDKQKQIEEMARILDEDCGDCHKCNYYDNEDSGGIECIFWLYAERIYNAGYRKQSETAEKFAEMANKRIAQRQGERDCYEAFTIDDKARYDGDIVSLALFEICKEMVEGK